MAHAELSELRKGWRGWRGRASWSQRSRGALCAAVLASSSVSSAQGGGLSLETGSPDALCPELAITRDAVQRRLGELVVPSGAGWKARYTIGHAHEGTRRDFVRLELFGPDGIQQLARDLPLEGESCSTMADVIALILDRYFRALPAAESSRTSAFQSAPDGPNVDVDVPAPEPTLREPQNAALPPAARDEPLIRETRVELVGEVTSTERLDLLGAELAASHPERPALGLRGLFELWPESYWGAALLASVRPETERLPAGGDVSTRGVNLRTYLAWGPRFGSVRTYLGPGVRVTLERGSGRGLPRGEQGYRAVWGLGADLGVLWAANERWQLTFSSAIDVALLELGGRFVVDGDEVMRAERVKGWFGIGLGYAFAP